MCNFVLSSQIMQIRETPPSHGLNETFDQNVKLHMIGDHPELKEQLVESKQEEENNKKEKRTEKKDGG